MVNKVRGSVIDLPGVSSSKPVATTYPAGTVVFNSTGNSPVGWKYNGTDWEDFGATHLEVSATYDPPSISAGSYVSTTLSVPGALLGDYAKASFSLDITGCVLDAFVSGASTVTAVFRNLTGGSINLASGTLRVRVDKK